MYLPLLFLFLFLFFPHSTPQPTHPLIQCLHNHSIPPSLILTPKSTNFTPTFLSSARSPRLLLSPNLTKPSLIITPTHPSHAQAAVLCSKSLNFHLRTRSGGHDYEGLSYSSALARPFLILDLFHLRSISFNPDNTLWAQSGATLGELYFSIASRSGTLAFPAGFCTTVCVGGHISGGGIGTIMRAHGVAADCVVDIRIVNSDGEILERGGMGEEVFWALRGGGGASFGVVLAYKLKLVRVPPKVTVFSKSLSQGATKAVAKWQCVAYKTDNRLYISALARVVDKSVYVTFGGLFLGEMAELLPIMEQGFSELEVGAKDCKEMSWIESAVIFSSFPLPDINIKQPLRILLDRNPNGLNVMFKLKSDIVREPIVEQSWEEIWKYVLKGDEQIVMLIEPLGGKVAEIAEADTPFPHRNGSLFVIQYLIYWFDSGEKEAEKHIDWLRGFYEFMATFVSKEPRAAYVNFRDLDLGRNSNGVADYNEAEVWGRRYFKDNFKRLAYVKSKTDPHNFFKNEQSIPPLIY